MAKIRAVISGYYGQGNGGDEALLMSLLQMLPENVTPLVLSAQPAKTQQTYGVRSISNRSAFPILKALRQSDWFIWGGGSLMQDVTSLASPIYYAGLMALAQLQGLKTIAWAQGIGPLNHPLTRWLTKRVLQGCTMVSVRDQASAQLLKKWGISATIAPDPVWALKSQTVQELSGLPAPRIAVNLRRHSQLTPSRLDLLTQALINFQRATKACILLVPFQASQDQAIAESIALQLPGQHQIVSLENPRELKGLFRQIDLVIGMRYHSLIMAAAEGCRCFALSYDPKVTQLIKQLNLPGWELTNLPANPDLITHAWLKEYTNAEPLNLAQINSMVAQALRHQELFNNLLS